MESIRQALEKVLESEDLRREMGCRGRRKAESYRWEVSARKTWESGRDCSLVSPPQQNMSRKIPTDVRDDVFPNS